MGRKRERRAPLHGQSDDWSQTVVICAGTWWDAAPMPDQHMAKSLSRDATVLYVDPPVSWLTPLRHPELRHLLRGPRLRMVAPRIARLTPLAPPGKGRPGVRRVTVAFTRRAMRRAARRLGADVHGVVVVSLEPLFGVFGERRRVLYGTDDFVAGAEILNLQTAWLVRRERAQLDEATDVVAVTDGLANKWRAMAAVSPVVIPNGVDTSNYADPDHVPAPRDVTLSRPIAGFVGHLSHRIDITLLTAVAERGTSLLLVGPRQLTFAMHEMEALLALPNVQWVGPRAFADLPSYLKVVDVGLVPYEDSDFNRASSPLKALEYLAAGLPVVSTRLPYLHHLDTDLITPATGREEFADAVAGLLSEPRDQQTHRDLRRGFARRHDWRHRGDQMAALLGLERRATPQGDQAFSGAEHR